MDADVPGDHGTEDLSNWRSDFSRIGYEDPVMDGYDTDDSEIFDSDDEYIGTWDIAPNARSRFHLNPLGVGGDLEINHPHDRCMDYLKECSGDVGLTYRSLPPSWKVQLQVFRVCRQIYFEANQAFWKNTTFAFNDPYVFRTFMADRTSHQKKNLQKLHLTLSIMEPRRLIEWEVFPVTLLKSLVGMRVLHFQVNDENFCHELYLRDLSTEMIDLVRASAFDNILNLQILPLTDVTVIWGRFFEDEPEDEDDPWMWPHARSLEWAESFRKRFLDLRGLEVWQETKDRAKAERERKKLKDLEHKRKFYRCPWTTAECSENRREKSLERGKRLEECVLRHTCNGCNSVSDFDGIFEHTPYCTSSA